MPSYGGYIGELVKRYLVIEKMEIWKVLHCPQLSMFAKAIGDSETNRSSFKHINIQDIQVYD